MTEQPLWWPAWTLGDMEPVHMTCLTCGDPIRLGTVQTSRTKYRVWTHYPALGAVRSHQHNALAAPSLISELIALVPTERTEES